MKPRTLFILLFSLLLFSGCSDSEDILSAQKTKIVNFLTGSHNPRLIDERDLEPGAAVPFYTALSDNTVYRFIENFYDPDRLNKPEVNSFSNIEITFRAFVFNYSNIITEGTNQTLPFFTNDPLLEGALQDLGLDTTHWSFEPLKIDMKSTDIIMGLYKALIGCREGDRVKVYMTYNVAYGDINFSTIPKESPIAFFFTITSIEL